MRNKKNPKKSGYTIADNMHFILKEAWQNSRGLFWAMLIIILATLAGNLCITYTDKFVVELALGTSSRILLAGISTALIAGSRLINFVQQTAYLYEFEVGKGKFRAYLIGRLIHKKTAISYEMTEDPKIGDMLQKAYTAAEGVADQALDTMRETILSVLNILAYGGILSMLNPLLIFLIGIPAVTGYYISRRRTKWAWDHAGSWQKYDRQLEYILRAGSDFGPAKDIRVFGMQKWFDDVYRRVFQCRLSWHEKQDRWEYFHNILEQVVLAAANIAADVYVIYLVASRQIGAGDFVLYFNSIFMLSQAVQSWCSNYSSYQQLSNNISYARDYLKLEEETGAAGTRPLPQGPNVPSCTNVPQSGPNVPQSSTNVLLCSTFEIEFKNVSYTYLGAARPTIQNISFRLNQKEKLAIVGLNGAGKTTLIKLMCGLYQPSSGEILLNGVPAAHYHREEYFSLFSAVFQDIDIMPVTIAENIAGKKTEEIDFPKLFCCMKKSGIYDKVASLPQREGTYLVKSVHENAVEFSGGQLQKLALAKALYKDAPILLLDEPTAALDPIAEQEMYSSYAAFSKGKSSIFISHRLASTRFCDRILLLDEGKIAEEGTHLELMKKKGIYCRLYEIQSSYYKEGKGGIHDHE